MVLPPSLQKLASGWLARLYREGVEPSGSLQEVSDHISPPPLLDSSWRKGSIIIFPQTSSRIFENAKRRQSPRATLRSNYMGHLEQYPLSAISALAERGGCSTHAKVSPRSRTVLMPGGRPRGPFARHHADSTRERTQAGEAAIRSS